MRSPHYERPQGAPSVSIAVLKQTTARSASGWEHAYLYGGSASHNHGSNGFSDVCRPWGAAISAAGAARQDAGSRTPRQLEALHGRGVGVPHPGGTQSRMALQAFKHALAHHAQADDADVEGLVHRHSVGGHGTRQRLAQCAP